MNPRTSSAILPAMKSLLSVLRRLLPASLVALPLAGAAGAATELEVAPYVPSPQGIVAEMLQLADVGPEDYIIDLGAGDGRIVLTAAKEFGARGLGVEILEHLVESASRSAERLGVADRASFVTQDLWETDLSPASVVSLYLLPDTVNALRDKLLTELAPDSRVVSHDYPIEGWTAERFVELEHEDKVEVTGVARTNIYLYRVPADVAGRWTVTPRDGTAASLELEFTQRVTYVQGQARVDGQEIPLHEATLTGRRISFTFPDRSARFVGWVSDATIMGTVETAEGRRPWRAVRQESPPPVP
jgi:protein-L-isoaspartate O-methyltransferase